RPAGSASYAAYMLAQYVSPPEGGTSSAYRIAPIGGGSTYVMSACQIASPSPRPPIGTPSFLMFEMTFISGCSARDGPPYGVGPRGAGPPQSPLDAGSVPSPTL